MRLKMTFLFAVLVALPFVACQKNDDHADNNEAPAAAAQVAFRACKDKLNLLSYNYINECDVAKPINGQQSFAEWMAQKYGPNWNQTSAYGYQNYGAAYPNYGAAYPNYGGVYPNYNNGGTNVPTTPYNQSQNSLDAVQYFRFLRGECNSDDFRQLEMDYKYIAERPQQY